LYRIGEVFRHGKQHQVKPCFIDAGQGFFYKRAGHSGSQVFRAADVGFVSSWPGFPGMDTLSIRVPYALYQAVQREEAAVVCPLDNGIGLCTERARVF